MELAMASTSCAKQSPTLMKEPVMNYVQYPAPGATYEDVIVSPKLFMETLEKFHAAMGTKFMIPIIGGKELNLHRLFVEVTSRGGIEKIIRERRWKEVTGVFNFPSTATNASFVLRKYYGSLLQHYEQLYYFKARSWSPASPVPLQSSSISQCPAQVTVQPSPEYQAAAVKQQTANIPELCRGSSASTSVIGVIDGKFESGYLVTVTVGSEKLKGVLYQAPQNQSWQVPQPCSVPANNSVNTQAVPGTRRRRRRKKSEIKRRDPAHPKPNRSGYNFFFAEQHARLKPLYPGKDREISRMIGELWNKINDSQKAVYQDKALKDKERYKIEMEGYRERLRTGKVISDAVPLQQWLPGKDTEMVEVNVSTGETGGGSPQNDSSSGESDSEDKTAEKDLDMEASPLEGLGADSGDMDVETSAEVTPFKLLSKREENVKDEGVEKPGNPATENSETTVQTLEENIHGGKH
ncbi:high mobility group B protein 15 isoform X2 [Populus trichocarpa]|uniref:high mobility group B protein 15 isoform X2 n=1 Tax=Populus trichocarpa TaxID=3694 RepID=UPI000D18834B|nr:high mobility group B protein 15 isoform X2 [Populus trichocarpa]|eukprot:XP_024444425.1 high mobility group B protein 15 isoform X2 [Populus trichocarpa]